MDPNQFLGLISTATDRTQDTVRLGTIGTVADPATKATVVFDGEDQATSKEYFFATSDGLKTNDRVMLVRAGHSWLITGKVPSQTGHTSSDITLEHSQGMVHFHGTGGPMGFLWRGDAAEGSWESQLVYRTNPNTLGVEDGSNSPVMEWDVDDLKTTAFGNLDVLGSRILIQTTVPQIKFEDTDANVGFWFHQNGNLFYLLSDRDGNGSWETPYPFRVDIVGDSIKFWNGGNELEILNGSSMIRGDGNYTFGAWSSLFLRAGNTDWWQIGTGGDLVSSDHGDDPRLVINNSSRGHNFYGDSDTGTTRRAAGSGGMNLTADGSSVMLATGGSTGTVAPSSDNNVNLGTSSLRWEHLYVADGQVRTSDLSQKEDVQPSDLGLDFIRRLSPIKYRRKDGGNRPRYGLGADHVRTVLDDMGVADFGGYVDPSIVDPAKAVNPWAAETLTENNRKSLRTKAVGILELRGETDEEEVQGLMEEIRQTREAGWMEDFEKDRNGPKGLRYDEFIAPMIKAIQELSDRMDAFETSRSPV